jgi:DNA-binding XRE family transcriptional regulator
MKTKFRLKLLRALTGLSQKEMADLAGVSHFFISIIEKEQRDIPELRALKLSDALNIDTHWLTGKSNQIIADKRFVLFCYDGSKAVGASVSTLNRSISANSKIVAEYLPEVLAQSSNISYRCIWRMSPTDAGTDAGTDALFFVVFGGHGLLMKIVNCKMMVDTMVGIVEGLKNLDGSEISPVMKNKDLPIPPEVFSSITYASPSSLEEFIDLQDIDDGRKRYFKDAINDYYNTTLRIASTVENGKHLKTLELATSKYVLEQRNTRFKINCDELIKDRRTLSEIREYYKSKGKNDLIEDVVNV